MVRRGAFGSTLALAFQSPSFQPARHSSQPFQPKPQLYHTFRATVQRTRSCARQTTFISPSNAVVFPHHLNSPLTIPSLSLLPLYKPLRILFCVLLPAVSVILQITSSTQIIKEFSLSLSRS
ncbi:uncharacterized protein IAS62_002636 [Cryptococcus decagattii]|uniref:Uncharacterized protein n=1 Tax=Cryptococcus decagattii TaxID=1859122 RepID=A0ABZ2AS28_9TREE